MLHHPMDFPDQTTKNSNDRPSLEYAVQRCARGGPPCFLFEGWGEIQHYLRSNCRHMQGLQETQMQMHGVVLGTKERVSLQNQLVCQTNKTTDKLCLHSFKDYRMCCYGNRHLRLSQRLTRLKQYLFNVICICCAFSCNLCDVRQFTFHTDQKRCQSVIDTTWHSLLYVCLTTVHPISVHQQSQHPCQGRAPMRKRQYYTFIYLCYIEWLAGVSIQCYLNNRLS